MEDVHWLVPTLAATSCWALSDVCCDYAIAGGDDDDAPPPPDDKERRSPQMSTREADKGDEQLTPEQNAVVSASVAAAAGSALFMYQLKSKGATQTFDRDTAVAMAAGAVHFCAYAVELRAFRTASSTVITPLLQLSAVWMTLVRVIQPVAAVMVSSAGGSMDEVMPTDFYVATAAMHPFHFAAIFLIFVGGFLPAAKGDVRKFGTCSFYKQEAVACCVIGELLICVYNALLHACTFKREDQAASVLRFFVASRAGNALGCLVAILFIPSFSHIRRVRRCGRRYVLIAFLGECLSVIGVAVVMLSYASFHEPAVVNAAEGGVQQLLNLLFAVSLRAFCGFGRAVTDVWTKLVSFALIAAGLALSAVS
ncbi:unnamed protein product [Pelagomonas calceolata]|uniref:Integral membrane protein n=1 Tax=Pelagomonas calceolata TaxID=35677 RepID=A0A8J2SMC3_9STRA|nr:unnamed protein product [Pelagomonas calceolata]|mmetsp:Transcript_24570/g.74834  ORF Transcript_24570/g.74834 Transcript_24570/m.74834 type:complete len:367 (+) Transcript_24570:266-1366(+)